MQADIAKLVERSAALAPDRNAIENFIYREARLQDESRYEEWEALWADDGIYWVPANDHDLDPSTQVSFIYDNRTRLSGRIRQLLSGRRHAQIPPSRMCRVVSNLEIEPAGPLVRVFANFMLTEVRNGRRNLWCGRTRYDLRASADGFQLVLKKVMLVDSDIPIPTLGFLI